MNGPGAGDLYLMQGLKTSCLAFCGRLSHFRPPPISCQTNRICVFRDFRCCEISHLSCPPSTRTRAVPKRPWTAETDNSKKTRDPMVDKKEHISFKMDSRTAFPDSRTEPDGDSALGLSREIFVPHRLFAGIGCFSRTRFQENFF